MFYLCQKKILLRAVKILRAGGIVAFPTEGVYGLSCDPFNEKAIQKLLALKKRSVDKGLILLASIWRHVSDLVENVPPACMTRVKSSWPEPITWVFPARRTVPFWISGGRDTVAIRITAHPLAKALCDCYGGPIVSTSANVEGCPPALNRRDANEYFPQGRIELILPGKLGGTMCPTEIRDALTGEVLRGGNTRVIVPQNDC